MNYRRLSVIAIVLAAVLYGFVSYSQTLGPNEVFVNQPFRIAADHNGVDTTSYELRQGTTLVSTVPASALANGVITFPPTQHAATGTYPYFVVAIGPGGSTSVGPYNVVVRFRFPAGLFYLKRARMLGLGRPTRLPC